MGQSFKNLNEEQLAVIRARIQKSIDDPRPSISAEEAFANLTRYHKAQLNSDNEFTPKNNSNT